MRRGGKGLGVKFRACREGCRRTVDAARRRTRTARRQLSTRRRTVAGTGSRDAGGVTPGHGEGRRDTRAKPGQPRRSRSSASAQRDRNCFPDQVRDRVAPRQKQDLGGRTLLGLPCVPCSAGRPSASVELTRNPGVMAGLGQAWPRHPRLPCSSIARRGWPTPRLRRGTLRRP